MKPLVQPPLKLELPQQQQQQKQQHQRPRARCKRNCRLLRLALALVVSIGGSWYSMTQPALTFSNYSHYSYNYDSTFVPVSNSNTEVSGNHSDATEATTNSSQVPLICQTPPNQGDPDDETLRYSLLRRIQYYLSSSSLLLLSKNGAQKYSNSMPRIMCILPFFPSDLLEAALETFVLDCDGVLILRLHHDNTTIHRSVLEKNVLVEYLTVNVTADDNEHADQQLWQTKVQNHLLASPNPMDWIYWASPDRYPFLGFMRLALLHLLKDNSRNITINNTHSSSPLLMESWLIRELWEFKYPRGIAKHQGDCSVARLWNWAALPHILPSCRQTTVASSDSNATGNVTVQCKPSPHVTCQPITAWSATTTVPWIQVLHRYHGLELGRPIAQFPRVHAILHGLCDEYWDRDLGALDEQGRPGYVHDSTFLRHHPRPLQLSLGHDNDNETEGVCGLALGKGDEGPTGAKGLQKIELAEIPPNVARKKVLCMIYTHEKQHGQLAAIVETWGPKCDGFFAGSTKTDPSLGAVHLLHEGKEEYGNMWMKVQSMFKYAYQHYIDDYDFFHIGGDDHYVIVENLQHIIATGNWKGSWNQSAPLFLGGSMGMTIRKRYCGGGSGYTMNAPALRLLVEEFMALPDCGPHWKGPEEDMFVSACFREAGIQCMDTNDERLEARYHPMPVNYHAAWNKHKPLLGYKVLLSRFHNITFKEGLGQISKHSVSFHLKDDALVHKDAGMRRIHAILYRSCPPNTTLARDLS